MKLSRFLFACTITIPLFSQQPTNFQNYSDMKNIRDLQSTENGIWAATGGGGFSFNSAEESFIQLYKTDGLNGSALSSVAVDGEGKIWFGSRDGIIDVYNPSTKLMKSLLDISNSDRSQKQINNITISGDTAFISTDFGITLIDIKTLVFYDTFFKFGSFNSNIKVNNSLITDRLYVATVSGAAVQKDGATNLSAPESWNIYQMANGLPSNNVNKIISFKDSIIAATASGMSYFNGQIWTTFLPEFLNRNILDIISANDILYFISRETIAVNVYNYKIHSYNAGELTELYSTGMEINKLDHSASMGLLAATISGILKLNGSEASFIFPNGPAVNQFPDMTVDNGGRLWSASGKDGQGAGIYSFDNGEWKTFNASVSSQIITNDFYEVYAAPDNTIFAGSWGRGFVTINNDEVKSFNVSNTPIRGIPNDPNFIVISGFAHDSRNNLWILNYWPGDRNALWMVNSDSTWHGFINPAEQNRSLEQHYDLVIDQYDTKWYTVLDGSRPGVYFFNEGSSLENSSDDRSGYLSSSNGLNSNTVNALVIDRRGDIWAGTNLGVNIITNQNTILSSANPQLRINSVFTLRQQAINCIAVDPLNQKWVGTNQGLLLVNADGTSLIAALDSKNSPLLSDIITSIAIDENSGKVYVGTSEGLTSFETPAIKPVDTFTELFIYPSPYIIDGSNKIITIDGLVRGSDIKILNVSGKLIHEFSSPGGRVAYWDGRDTEGNFVSTGVYFVVAFDQEGNSVNTGKIAVLKK
jgi:ligand-binding sensor domain-containing protein